MGDSDDPRSESPTQVCSNKEDFKTQEAKFKTGNKGAWVSCLFLGLSLRRKGGDERRRREGLVGKGGEKGENKVEKGNKQEAREAAD